MTDEDEEFRLRRHWAERRALHEAAQAVAEPARPAPPSRDAVEARMAADPATMKRIALRSLLDRIQYTSSPKGS